MARKKREARGSWDTVPYGQRSFTAKEAAKFHGVSKTTAYLRLQDIVYSGKMCKVSYQNIYKKQTCFYASTAQFYVDNGYVTSEQARDFVHDELGISKDEIEIHSGCKKLL